MRRPKDRPRVPGGRYHQDGTVIWFWYPLTEPRNIATKAKNAASYHCYQVSWPKICANTLRNFSVVCCITVEKSVFFINMGRDDGDSPRYSRKVKWRGVAVAERRRCCSSFLPASFFASPLKRPSVDSRKRASGAIWGWTEKYGIVDAFRTLRAGHACCFLKWGKNCIFLSGKGGSLSFAQLPSSNGHGVRGEPIPQKQEMWTAIPPKRIDSFAL